MIAVIAGTAFLERPVLDRSNTRARIVTILAVDALRKRIERVKEHSARQAFFELDGAGVEGRMAEIRPQQNIAHLCIGSIILRCGEYLGLERWVACSEIDREGVGLPVLDQSDTRRALITRLNNVIPS